MLTIYTDANDWSTATVTIPDTTDGTATQDVFVPFTSFSSGAGTGADFTNVGAIQLVLSGPAAVNAQVANVETLGPTVQVHNFANSVEADLVIAKTADPNPVDAGKPLTYSLTATNDGPSNGTGVTVVDTLPAGVVYTSSTTTQGTVSVSGNVVTISLGAMASSATATITILVNVNSDTSGASSTRPRSSGNEPDPNLTNNTATCTVTVNTPIHVSGLLTIYKGVSPTYGVHRRHVHVHAASHQRQRFNRHRRDRVRPAADRRNLYLRVLQPGNGVRYPTAPSPRIWDPWAVM